MVARQLRFGVIYERRRLSWFFRRKIGSNGERKRSAYNLLIVEIQFRVEFAKCHRVGETLSDLLTSMSNICDFVLELFN